MLKWALVAVIIVIVVYTFRDSAGPVLNELKQTTFVVALGICAMAVVYHILEGFITTVLARQYQPRFRLWTGIKNAFICSFYRVATLGSGAGVAALIYLGEHGVSYSTGFGLYMTQYAVHKSSIALFSMLFFALCFPFMQAHFAEYQWLLAAGYVLTAIITLVLMLFACSVRFHKMLLSLLSFFNSKMRGRFDEPLIQLKEQCRMLEESSHVLLAKPCVMAGIAALNLIKFCFFLRDSILKLLWTGKYFADADHGGYVAFCDARGCSSLPCRYRIYGICVYYIADRDCRYGCGWQFGASLSFWHIRISVSRRRGNRHCAPDKASFRIWQTARGKR